MQWLAPIWLQCKGFAPFPPGPCWRRRRLAAATRRRAREGIGNRPRIVHTPNSVGKWGAEMR
jgi:hypothetical protein